MLFYASLPVDKEDCKRPFRRPKGAECCVLRVQPKESRSSPARGPRGKVLRNRSVFSTLLRNVRFARGASFFRKKTLFPPYPLGQALLALRGS
jgi:hypothetical protein